MASKLNNPLLPPPHLSSGGVCGGVCPYAAPNGVTKSTDLGLPLKLMGRWRGGRGRAPYTIGTASVRGMPLVLLEVCVRV